MTQREHPSGDPHLARFLGRRQQRPLIGRDDERATLRTLLLQTEARLQETHAAPDEHLLAARLPCVILQGEPGIGKTRLAEEMSLEALDRGWAVVWSSLYAQESAIPYRLWTQVLQQLVRQNLLFKKELQKHGTHYLPLVSLLPEFSELLSTNALPAVLVPELGQENLRLWESLKMLLSSVCERVPLLLVLDDLHCVDESSCELLGYLVRQLAGCPIMLLGTYRQHELPLTHSLSQLFGNLQRERLITVLTISALTEAQIGLLVADVPEPLLQQIQRQAAGNPLFAEELARVLPTLSAQDRAEGLLTSRYRHLTLTQTITAVFDQRLRRLSQDCQLLLGNAAVLGGSFSFSALTLMEMSGGSGFDEDTLYTLLEEALRAKVLTEKADGADALYHFWHPLLMSHLYEKLSASRRVSLHRRAADVLSTLYSSRLAEGAASIAYHLLQGNAPAQQIVHYAELAGNHAYCLSAYPEAERYYRMTLTYMDELAPTSERAPTSRAYILEVLGEYTRIQGKSEDARAFYEEALELRSRQELSSREAIVQMAQIRSLIVCEIGITWYNVGDSTRALLCYGRSEQYLREAHITDGPAWATIRFLQSYSSWREGAYEDARRMASEALTLFEKTLNAPLLAVLPVDTPTCSTRIRRILAGDPVDLGRTHALLGMVASTVGQPATAIRHLHKALELYEQQQIRREMATVYCTLSDLHLKKAEHEAAHTALQRSLELAQRIGDVPLIAVIYANFGLLAARTGKLAEAELHYKRGFALAEQVSDPVYTSMFLVYLALVLHELGRASEAVATLRRALTIGRARPFAPCIGFALIGLSSIRIAQAAQCSASQERMRLLARARRTLIRALALEGLELEMQLEGQMTLAQVLLDQGELQDALYLAQHTLQRARESELVWLIVRTLRVLGCTLAALNQQPEAHQSFQEALTLCREHGMHPDLARTLRCSTEALLNCESVNERYKALHEV